MFNAILRRNAPRGLKSLSREAGKAVINGTSAGDFSHRVGFNEITGVTTGADTIAGDVGNDTVFGDAGADSIRGDEGNDTLVGGQDLDRLFGGVGNDVFRIRAVSDVSGLAARAGGFPMSGRGEDSGASCVKSRTLLCGVTVGRRGAWWALAPTGVSRSGRFVK